MAEQRANPDQETKKAVEETNTSISSKKRRRGEPIEEQSRNLDLNEKVFQESHLLYASEYTQPQTQPPLVIFNNLISPQMKPMEEQSQPLPPPSIVMKHHHIPPRSFLLHKTLTKFDVIPHGARLALTEDEAYLLTLDERINVNPTEPFSRRLTAFDSINLQYTMIVSNIRIASGMMRYFVSGCWSRFVVAHQLEAGDEVTFYRLEETDEYDWYCLAVRHYRKPNSVFI